MLAALDDLVEFAAIEPDAAALGTIVDFHTLPVAHDQRYLTNGGKAFLRRHLS